ncbi:MAG: hypothetical protein KAV00_15745, partial [Phycisphaerae bacterium]|nr:hypothetical protein [Phycisphaerae bacterium]
MNARFYALFVLLAGCLIGCPHNRYEIEMKPAGNVLERTLSVSRVGGQTVSPAKGQGDETKPTTSKGENLESVPNEELDRLGKVYPKRLSKPGAEVHKFRIKFTGETPNDVGGFGSYRRFATRMGGASIYVERFRGDKNPARAVTERLRAVDELTDLLIGWFQSEMGKDKRFGKLRKLMDKEFRRDLKNASMYLWLHDLRSKEKSTDQYEMLMRIGLYFAERKYVRLEELPTISRALTMKTSDDDPVNSLMPLIQRFVASKMGIGPKEPVPDSLKFLADTEAAEKSLIVYIRSTKAFKEKMREWKKQRETEPDASEPEPLKIIQNLAEKAFHFELDLFSSDDE